MSSRREWLSYILTILFPFIFLLVMNVLKGVIDEPKPFIYVLQHPLMLVLSALFSNVGAQIGIKWLIDKEDVITVTKVKYTSFGVVSVFIVMAIIYLILNGGWSNPQ